MQIPAGLFTARGIHGVVPDTVDIGFAEALGKTLGTRLRIEGEKSIAVGRDGRLSGPALADALIDGLLATGLDVLDLGMVTTAMASFAAVTLARSVVQVTGGRDQADHNGFKLVLSGRKLEGEPLQELRRAMQDEEWTLASTPGSLREVDVLEAYIQRIRGEVQLARPLKIVLDCGHGVAGASAPAVFRAIGCEVLELATDVADPAPPGGLEDLLQAVRDDGADLGLAIYGDGDAVQVVTASGDVLTHGQQQALLAGRADAAAGDGTCAGCLLLENVARDMEAPQRPAVAVPAGTTMSA